MPKMKSNRAARKRFKVTGSGRVKRSKAGKSHNMRFKPASRLRRVKKSTMVSDADEKRIKRLLPYG
jgi:large subunit ribosomal protein L35